MTKNGKTIKGVQRWQCNRCKKHFQLAYKHIARKQGIKEKIIEQTLNSSRVRDTGRILGISKNTVTSVLKKTQKANPYFLTTEEKSKPQNLEIAIKCTSEIDEFWRYVQNKTNQRWTWYVIGKKSGCILAWHNGKQQDKDFLVL